MPNETYIQQKCVNLAENSHANQPLSISLLEQGSQDPTLFPGLPPVLNIYALGTQRHNSHVWKYRTLTWTRTQGSGLKKPNVFCTAHQKAAQNPIKRLGQTALKDNWENVQIMWFLNIPSSIFYVIVLRILFHTLMSETIKWQLC